jgi:hypothetical protein
MGNSLPNNIKITGRPILFGTLQNVEDLLYRLLSGTFGPLQENLGIILWKLKKPLGIFRRVLSIVQKERDEGGP